MTESHPEIELIGHLRDELAPADRARVESHLVACAECRRTAATFQAILSDLRASEPPAIHWGQWMAELRGRLEAVRSRQPWWRQHPVAIAAAGVAAVVLIALALPFGSALFEHSTSPDLVAQSTSSDLAALEEVSIGSRLDLLQQYQLVEHLDLLEDLDVISHLDRLERGREG